MDESAVTNSEPSSIRDTVRDGLQDSVRDDVRGSFLDKITIAHIVYAGIIVIAALLRLGDLGLIPLSPDEAAEAIGVWRFWELRGSEMLAGSPIYFSLNVFLSQLVGFSDASMRLAPALFGLAIVPMPWLIRNHMGKIGPLMTGALFAISPTLVLISRTAGGQSAALFAGMLVFVAWLRFDESKQEKWLYGIAIGLGIGFISTALFINLIICIALARLIQRNFGRPVLEEKIESDHLTAASETAVAATTPIRTQTIIRCSALFAAIVTLGSTAIFLNLPGFGSSVSLITDWLQLFTLSGDALTLITPVLSLGRYELIILFIGGIAVVWATWKGKAFPLLLTYWFILALILTFLQRGYVFNVLLLTIPGYLLVGTFLNSTISKPISGFQLLLTGSILVMGIVILINIARYARLLTVPGSTASRYNILLSITLLAIISVAVILAWNWDERAAKQAVIISSLIILIIVSWGSTWWLSRSAANDTRERWVSQATADDIRILEEAIRDVSWQLKNSDRELQLTSTIDSPALEWYLRDLDQLKFVSTIPKDLTSDALLTSANLEPILEQSYVGSKFSYLRPDTTHVLDLGQALRWWLFHQSPVSINQEQLIFWVRADLLGESD